MKRSRTNEKLYGISSTIVEGDKSTRIATDETTPNSRQIDLKGTHIDLKGTLIDTKDTHMGMKGGTTDSTPIDTNENAPNNTHLDKKESAPLLLLSALANSPATLAHKCVI